MELCLGFSDTDWRTLRPKLLEGDSGAWERATRVVRARLEQRFLSGIELLVTADCGLEHTRHSEEHHDVPSVVPGFAILVLGCLLVETLQSFIDGAILEV